MTHVEPHDAAQRAEATYLHLRCLWQQGEVQRPTAEVRRAVCDQVARAGPSEALAEMRRTLVQLSPDVRGDDVDRDRVVGPGHNLRSNPTSAWAALTPHQDAGTVYVRYWRTSTSAGRSGHTRVSRSVDTCAASGERAMQWFRRLDQLLEDAVYTPPTFGDVASYAASEHEIGVALHEDLNDGTVSLIPANERQ